MDFATKVENDKRENTYIGPNAGKVSLRRYTEDCLNGVLLSGGTWESYERILRLHVLPHLGRKTIAQVTAADVEELYARWAKGGAKPNTIDERSLPSLEEIKAIAHAIGPRLEPAVWLMACGGLRIGESLGVFPEDFQDGLLRLRRQVVRYLDEDGLCVARYAPLKHRKEGEWRDVPVPEFFTAFADRVPILNQQGGMTYPGLVHASWDRAIKRLGIPDYTPHVLRHKWATVTLTNGVSIHQVSRWLGHRSIKITVDRYGHLTQDGRERCRQVVAATFEGYLPEELSVGLAA
ncbi:tyrosine-type recombinase/integrase [Streptomyces inhibens]|uniref:tyrosine-type recombinase/integrase n=1 Tax=Streptomyces inhibens TaxID=2293571 RepID=UPI0015F2844D|nr:site-specific integrase [Streptomyces inhibens]